jgi:hypothetical protein
LHLPARFVLKNQTGITSCRADEPALAIIDYARVRIGPKQMPHFLACKNPVSIFLMISVVTILVRSAERRVKVRTL